MSVSVAACMLCECISIRMDLFLPHPAHAMAHTSLLGNATPCMRERTRTFTTLAAAAAAAAAASVTHGDDALSPMRTGLALVASLLPRPEHLQHPIYAMGYLFLLGHAAYCIPRAHTCHHRQCRAAATAAVHTDAPLRPVPPCQPACTSPYWLHVPRPKKIATADQDPHRRRPCTVRCLV